MKYISKVCKWTRYALAALIYLPHVLSTALLIAVWVWATQ